MNIIKFPGYLHEERKGFWHGCKYYAVLKDLIGDLTETEKARLTGFAILSLFPFLATMAVAECAQLAKATFQDGWGQQWRVWGLPHCFA